jgi:pimeloyl-ACP methyl ester carboxylesterase
MARIKANGIEFEYDEMGPADGEPIVLVMGFTAQMTKWPEAFRKGLVAAGYRVIRFDNRDIGLSHQFDYKGLPDIPAITQAVVSGQDASGLAPYTLNDMAADVAALIDALDAKPAHVLGASMGGMIVQLLAINHPEHVRSMIPVMTTSGDPALPPSTPKAREALTMQPESPSREDVVKLGVYVQGEIGSDRSIADTDEERAISVGASYDRAYRPMGTMRQYAAILTQPRWHENLSNVKAPTMVLHGEVDPLITVAGGQDIVDRVDGAKLVVIPKWGHDVPKSVVPELVSHVKEFLAGV